MNDELPWAQFVIAQSQSTSAEHLEELLDSELLSIALEASRNPNLPPQAIEDFPHLIEANLIQKSLSIFHELSLSEQISIINKIKDFYEENPFVSLLAVANWEDADSDDQDWCDIVNQLEDPIMQSCRMIANIVNDQNVLRELIELHDIGIYREFFPAGEGPEDFTSITISSINNPAISRLQIEEFALKGNGHEIKALIDSKHCDEALIDLIAENTLWCERYDAIEAVLSHTGLTSENIEKLFGKIESWDEDFIDEAYIWIAQHPNTAREILDSIISESEEAALYAKINLAARQDTSVSELAAFAIDEDIDVRSAAFNNPKATEEIRASAALLGINGH